MIIENRQLAIVDNIVHILNILEYNMYEILKFLILNFQYLYA